MASTLSVSVRTVFAPICELLTASVSRAASSHSALPPSQVQQGTETARTLNPPLMGVLSRVKKGRLKIPPLSLRKIDK